MKTFAAFTSLLFLFVFSSRGDEVIPEFHVSQIDEIRAAKGTKVKIYGKITRTNKSKNTGTNFINFETKDFSLVTFGRNLAAFTKGEPADLFDQKFVEVTGTIEFYKDNPQIVLKSPDQIREVSERAPPSAEPEKKETAKTPVAPPKEIPKKVDPKKYFTD